MARASRVCPVLGCPRLTPGGRCPTHARPSANARGYTSAHQRQRQEWEPRVATGTVRCWRCGELISPSERWDLGHDDADRRIVRGPEHADRCNRSAAGRAAHGLPPR